MTDYNYIEAVMCDVLSYIRNNIDYADYDSIGELHEYLNDTLWAEDSVTGNASGSYYCNAYKAEEAIAHNWDILAEALEEFGCTDNPIERGAEWCDVTLRCYALDTAITEALDIIEDDFNAAHDDEDEEEE